MDLDPYTWHGGGRDRGKTARRARHRRRPMRVGGTHGHQDVERGQRTETAEKPECAKGIASDSLPAPPWIWRGIAFASDPRASTLPVIF